MQEKWLKVLKDQNHVLYLDNVYKDKEMSPQYALPKNLIPFLHL